MCADHCINWSLSDPKDVHFQNTCDHIHCLQCDRCQLLKDVHLKLCNIVDTMNDGDDKEEFSKVIEDAMMVIFDWKSHIVRTVNQDQFRLDTIEHLETDKALLVMDWAMKFLPLKYREKQTDWFGQRGKNWHVIVCIYREKDGSINHRTFTHVLESVKQDWFCVASLLENVIMTIKDQLPQTKKLVLRSDNAACYHCGHIWLCLQEISKRTGINIQGYCYSEAQAGKSYCDSKIAHMRTKMKSWVASGKNIVTAADMKTALDSGTGVAGCQVSECVIDTSKHKLITHKLKGINDFNELQVEEDGILLRKAYNIGKGKFIPNASLDQMGFGKQQENESGCVVISGFDLPVNITGKIKTHKTVPTVNLLEGPETEIENDEDLSRLSSCHSESSDQMLFYCTVVGCVKRFATLNGLENHLLIGKHFLQLQRETTYDKIRHQWAQLCNEVVFTTKNKSTLTDGTEKEFSTSNMGWALKKGRRISRFPESVKNFLLAKFEEGNRTGKKCNPTSVAEEMKKMKNSNGEKMFPINHWLNASQITSYFSRLCSKGTPNPLVKTELDDEDLLAALIAIDEETVIANIQ
ncbi:uncharacterized protein LOC127702135 isoform X1 [Mytilus californianus]|uniref:uncharacterized protein LOC127702135 isoform X1 n=2 Tax=Mytilus californianus TaxID=6549 RepID=UPI002247A93C|nr:uncharacterized protein LOC127702135 isoform X1 [Mytilus californianus]